MRKKVMSEMERVFRPEFRNRLDGVIIFRALTKDEITEIVDLLLHQVQERLVEHNLTLTVSKEAKLFLSTEGYDPDFGARPLRRVIQSKIEDALSEGVLAGTFDSGGTVLADVEDGKIIFKKAGQLPTMQTAPVSEPTILN
jgi:ATP-dependent Clp protease ATP-binding subunit ClpC